MNNNNLEDELQIASPALCSTQANNQTAQAPNTINPFLSIQTINDKEKEEVKLLKLEERPPDRAAGGSTKIVSSPNIALICKTKQKSKTGNPLLQKLSGIEPLLTDTHSEMTRDKLSSHASRKISIKSTPGSIAKESFNNSFSNEEVKDKTLTSATKRSVGVRKKSEDSKSQSRKSEISGTMGPELLNTESRIQILNKPENASERKKKEVPIDFKERFVQRCCYVM